MQYIREALQYKTQSKQIGSNKFLIMAKIRHVWATIASYSLYIRMISGFFIVTLGLEFLAQYSLVEAYQKEAQNSFAIALNKIPKEQLLASPAQSSAELFSMLLDKPEKVLQIFSSGQAASSSKRDSLVVVMLLDKTKYHIVPNLELQQIQVSSDPQRAMLLTWRPQMTLQAVFVPLNNTEELKRNWALGHWTITVSQYRPNVSYMAWAATLCILVVCFCMSLIFKKCPNIPEKYFQRKLEPNKLAPINF